MVPKVAHVQLELRDLTHTRAASTLHSSSSSPTISSRIRTENRKDCHGLLALEPAAFVLPHTERLEASSSLSTSKMKYLVQSRSEVLVVNIGQDTTRSRDGMSENLG